MPAASQSANQPRWMFHPEVTKQQHALMVVNGMYNCYTNRLRWNMWVRTALSLLNAHVNRQEFASLVSAGMSNLLSMEGGSILRSPRNYFLIVCIINLADRSCTKIALESHNKNDKPSRKWITMWTIFFGKHQIQNGLASRYGVLFPFITFNWTTIKS